MNNKAAIKLLLDALELHIKNHSETVYLVMKLEKRIAKLESEQMKQGPIATAREAWSLFEEWRATQPEDVRGLSILEQINVYGRVKG